jgi:hypothetical protein
MMKLIINNTNNSDNNCSEDNSFLW